MLAQKLINKWTHRHQQRNKKKNRRKIEFRDILILFELFVVK